MNAGLHDYDDNYDPHAAPRAKLPVPDNVQDAIRTLIRWSGDDPDREGLLDTPARVGRAWKEYCQGYFESLFHSRLNYKDGQLPFFQHKFLFH